MDVHRQPGFASATGALSRGDADFAQWRDRGESKSGPMRLLLCLAEHAGEVVGIDDLLSQVWSDVNVSPTRSIRRLTSLRRLLGRRSEAAQIYRDGAAVGISDGGEGGAWDETSHCSRKERARNGVPGLFSGPRWIHVDGGSVLLIASCGSCSLQFRARTNNPTSPFPRSQRSRLQYCRSWSDRGDERRRICRRA